jgi:5-methylcytosine-specific restriction endonuclease McrA
MTAETKYNVKVRDGNRCLRCGTAKNLTIDHVIPLCKGGSSNQANLQTLCFSCNQRKNKGETDYRRRSVSREIELNEIRQRIEILKRKNDYLR